MNVRGVQFSPDGRTISFLWSKDDEKTAVWGIAIDGGAQQKLAAVEDASVRSYDWSPDGSTIYMLVGAAEDKSRKSESKAGFNSKVYEEEAKWTRLFAANATGGVDSDPREISLPGYVSQVRIAPDGRTAVVDSAPTPQVDDSYTSKRPHIVDLATGAVRTIVETPGKVGDIEISPDGSQFSMIAGVDKNDPADTTLHLVDMATGQYRALNGGAAEAAVDAEFLPDGKLAAVIHKGATSYLRFYSAQGAELSETEAGGLAVGSVAAAGNKISSKPPRLSTPPSCSLLKTTVSIVGPPTILGCRRSHLASRRSSNTPRATVRKWKAF